MVNFFTYLSIPSCRRLFLSKQIVYHSAELNNKADSKDNQ